MVVDGKAIATQLLEQVAAEAAKLPRTPRLSAITCAPNFETRKYLEMKKRRAAAVGVALNVVELPEDIDTKGAVACVEQMATASDGVVVQLPLPAGIDRETVLAAVPADKDPDGFSYGRVPGACLPPVAGAIDEISRAHQVTWQRRGVVVLGAGRLVGGPVAEYAQQAGAAVTVLTEDTFTEAPLHTADIIVSGIGQAHFIQPNMVKEGVVIFDAGTSEEGGVLVGDVDPAVSEKAALLTPVPGGIGPITIAYLLRNLVILARQQLKT